MSENIPASNPAMGPIGGQPIGTFAHQLLDNLYMFVGLMTPDGTLIDVNRAPLVASGLTASDVVGRKFWDCYWWSHSADLQEELRSAVSRASAGEVIRFDALVRMPGDARRWVELQLAPLRGPDGSIAYLVPSAIDITRRKHVEDALRAKTEQLESLLTNAPLGVAYFDEKHRYVLVNQELAHMNGLSIQAHLGRTIEELFPKTSEAVGKALDRIFGGSEAMRNVEITGETPREPGVERHWLCGFFPVHDSRGAVTIVGAWAIEITELKRTERSLRESEARLTAVLDHLPVGVFIADASGQLVQANPKAREIWAESPLVPAHAYGEYKAWWPETGERLTSADWALTKVIGDKITITDEVLHIESFDGAKKVIRNFATPLRSVNGEDYGAISVVEDITEAQRAAEALRRSRERLREAQEQFQQLAEHVPEALWITELERGSVVYVSPAFARIHGVELRSFRMVWRRWKDTLHPEDRAKALTAHEEMKHRSLKVEYRIVRPDGHVRWLQACSYPVKNAEGKVYRVAGTIEDITDRRRMRERLQRQAHFDSLTGLPNRVLFFDRLNYALAQAKRHGRPVAMLFVDVDRFKIVNDTFGHAVGDKLLQGIADCLKNAVRAEDTVSRLGGDEFAIVLPRVERPEHAALVAEKALTCLSQPFLVEGQEVVTSASIGVALSSSDGSDAQSLLKRADKAMFRAKAAGRNGYAFYTAPMADTALEQFELERNLRRALERDEFVLHFQPKRNIADGTISGCEGLLRWATAAGELIEPLRFIPALEESGLIRPVGAWVIRAACEQIASWRQLGLEPIPVAVNLSVKQFDGGDVAEIVETALREHELDGRLLQIELTESAAMENLEQTIAVLGKLKSYGVTIAIDDFGTGHSSLSYLKRLPIDVLKIDSSFITGVPENENDASIVHAIITMAHSLGIKVVAEGVETDEQLAFLAEHGCDEMQGYLFSAPLPSSELARFASARIH